MKRGSKAEQLRAGAFVAVGLLVFVAAIFLLGKKNALFGSTDTLFVNLKDVNGLVVGAPVRLSGLEVGTVAAITFPSDLRVKEAHVRLVVRRMYMERIREDSRAFVDSSGLLGDKIINISLGDPSYKQLKDGATIKAGETLTFEALSSTLYDAINSVNSVAQDAQRLFGGMRESNVQQDVQRITASFANILGEIERGDGTAHRLIYEPKYAEDLAATLSSTRGAAEKMDRAFGHVDAIVAEIERGNGGLHQLVYEPVAADAVTQLGLAAREISEIAREVREGNGALHTLIYQEESANFVAQLNELAETLNRMASEIERGRGTVGGLIKDPTVYEDLKTVLGNVRRNVLFKSLVRFTIEEDGLRKAENAPKAQAVER